MHKAKWILSVNPMWFRVDIKATAKTISLFSLWRYNHRVEWINFALIYVFPDKMPTKLFFIES